MIWVEKYRPKDIDEFICSESTKEKFKSFINNKEIPHLLFFSSSPGTGKTTMAKILVNSIPCNRLYINASEERGIDALRGRIKDFSYYTGTEDLKICILDEADYLTPQFQAALRNILETTYEHTRFILTCNYPTKIIEPIRSRCQTFEFKTFTKDQIVYRLKSILEEEGIEYKNEDITEIARNTYPDIRAAINTCQKLIGGGNKLLMDRGGFVENTNVTIFKLLLQKKWRDIRKICLEEGVSYPDLYKFLFDEFVEFGDKIGEELTGKILLIIVDRMVKDSMVSSPEMNFAGCCLEIISLI